MLSLSPDVLIYCNVFHSVLGNYQFGDRRGIRPANYAVAAVAKGSSFET